MTTYGYIRKGFPTPLIAQAMKICRYQCDQLLVEEEALNVTREFDKMLAYVSEGDTIVTVSLKAFGKRSDQLLDALTLFSEQQVRLISIDDQLDTQSKEQAAGFYDVVLLLHEAKAGMTLEQRSGRPAGRPRISEEKAKLIKELREEEQYSMRQIAKVCEVSVGTVCRYLNTAP